MIFEGEAIPGDFDEIRKFREIRKPESSLNFKVSIRIFRFAALGAKFHFVMAAVKIPDQLETPGAKDSGSACTE